MIESILAITFTFLGLIVVIGGIVSEIKKRENE